jgi:hypothetical protein
MILENMNEFEVNEFEECPADLDDRTGAELYAEFLSKVERPKDEFVYYYGKYLSVMSGLTGAATSLLFWLAMNTEVNTGRVLVQSMAQRGALAELGITVGTYYKALNQLKELGLIKGKNAVYYVNPAYVWKGTADARSKFMKVYPRL